MQSESMQEPRESFSGQPTPTSGPVNLTSRYAKPARPVDSGPQELLAALRRLTPEIASRAQEVESGRALPVDLFEKIAATGIFHMLETREFGGAEYRLPEVIPIIEEIARADGSTAWNVLVGTEASAIWQHFDRKVTASIFAGDRDVMTRAPLTPRGTATRVKDGFLLKGRWPLGSGAYENEWFLFGAMIVGSEANAGGLGLPDLCICAVPAASARVLDTWDAIGLRSTMSHDVVVEETFVPVDHSIPMPWAADGDGPTIARLPMWLVFGPFHCAMVLGVARGSLEEIVTLAKSKRPFLNPTIRMAEDPLIQYRVGSLEMRLAAARSLVIAECEAVWELAAAKSLISPLTRARFRSTVAFVHTECMSIANEIFTLAGSNVLYNTSSLQRRYRDMRAACQHVVASNEIYRPFGALVLGEEPPEMLV
jgi:indole-3-acetate monooxygenase